MASNDIIVRLRAIGQAAFTAAMNEAATSVGKVAPQAQKSAAATGKMDAAASKAAPKWKTLGTRLAGFAALTGGIYAAKRAITGAFHATEDLAGGTARLMRTTGMEAEEASAWAEITKVRGVETNSFQRGLVALSKQMESARLGGKAAKAMFADLGVSMDAIRSGNTQEVMLQMADGFAAMQNPATKAAYAQKLLARQGQELLPLFNQGSAAIKEQMGFAQKYGATLSGEGVQSSKDLIARQREMKIATDGLKVSLGEALLPTILGVATALTKLVGVLQPFLRNTTAVQIAVVAVTTAFVAYKVAVIASTIASMGMVAVWALIPLAIIAIGAALVYAYKKVGWFRNAVNAAFDWIKNHWKLLLGILTGPFGAAAILIISHWDKVKAAIKSVIGVARSVVSSVIGAFRSLWNAIRDGEHAIVRGFVNFGKNLVNAIVEGIKSAPGAILDAIKGLLPGGKLGKKVLGALGLPGAQFGGVVRSPGVALVGEAGPELVRLNAGARIDPLPSPTIAASTLGGLGGGGVSVAPVYLDGRVVGQVMAQRTADQQARR